MKTKTLALILLLCACFCMSGSAQESAKSETETVLMSETETEAKASAVNFERSLDSYIPQKNHYNFYFTYKIVHPWWDAVALGIEEAQRQLLERGITVTYEYMAPVVTSAKDQEKRLREAAAGGDYDVIGADVIRPQVTETTALGAAYLAGIATGFWAGIDEVKQQWKAEKVFTPSASEAEVAAAKAGWAGAIARTLTR